MGGFPKQKFQNDSWMTSNLKIALQFCWSKRETIGDFATKKERQLQTLFSPQFVCFLLFDFENAADFVWSLYDGTMWCTFQIYWNWRKMRVTERLAMPFNKKIPSWFISSNWFWKLKRGQNLFTLSYRCLVWIAAQIETSHITYVKNSAQRKCKPQSLQTATFVICAGICRRPPEVSFFMQSTAKNASWLSTHDTKSQ